MPAVTSSSIRTEDPQKDGRRWVHLAHLLDDGSVRESSTLIDGSTTPTKLKNARVNAIEAEPARSAPDRFMVALDEARDAWQGGDRARARSKLTVAVEEAR